MNVLSAGERRRIPNQLMRRNSQVMPVDPALVLEPDDAVISFEAHGGHLTLFSSFGHDPLCHRDDLIKLREEQFFSCFPDFSRFFHTVVNNDMSLFREGLLFFVSVSKRLELQL